MSYKFNCVMDIELAQAASDMAEELGYGRGGMSQFVRDCVKHRVDGQLSKLARADKARIGKS